MIKIDVEGFELSVLKSLDRILHYSSPVLVVEINPLTMKIADFTYNDICQNLLKNQYLPLISDVQKDLFENGQPQDALNQVFLKENCIRSFIEHNSLFGINYSILK